MGNGYTKIIKDTNYVNLKTKLSSVEGSGLRAVGVKDYGAFYNLKSNIIEKLNSLSSSGTWNDQTSAKIQNEMVSGIKSIIEQYEKPINIVMMTVGGHVDELKKALDHYDNNVDNYNALVDEFDKVKKPAKDSYKVGSFFDSEKYESAIRNYTATCNSYKANIDSIYTFIINLSTHISTVITTIKTLMSPEGMYTGTPKYATFDYKNINTPNIVPYVEPEDTASKLRELTGKELEEFRESHNVREGDDITVIEDYQIINGVNVPYYRVYTNKYEYDVDFEVYSNECIAQMKKMDPVLLEYLVGNGTEVVLLEDSLISTYNSDSYCGLYWPDSKVVQMRYPGPYGPHSMSDGIIHELGHAMDDQLTENDNYWICDITSSLFCEKELIEEVFTDDTGKVVYWDVLIQKECGDMFPCGTPEDTAQNVENTRNTPSEYIAELTKRYFVSEYERERMKAVAPESYAALERMLSYVHKKVGH